MSAPAQSTNQPPTRLRGDIQGLRAVAVGLVVLSHAGVAGFAGGYVGVDVFFVISGFLITGILLRELDRTGRVSLLGFYARRARRILPAASVTLLAVTVASALSFGYVRVADVLGDVTWASLFGANINEALSGADYFAQDTFVSPVQHFWSLAVEEQFYLAWPLLILLVALVTRRVAPHRRTRVGVAVALLLACVASLAWSVHQTGASPNTAYFSTFTRAWELGAGAALALLATRLRALPAGLLNLCSLLGLVAIAIATVGFSASTPFPGSAALLPVLGSVLVIGGGLREHPRGASVLLDRAPMRWLGNISYSLYLWHWPFLMIPVMALGHELSSLWTANAVIGAVAVSALTYRWVETPFRLGRFWSPRLRAIGLWPGAVGVVMAAVGLTWLQLPSTASAPANLDPEQAGRSHDLILAVQHAAERAREHRPLPAHLNPSPLHLEDANWKLDPDCWANLTQDSTRLCTYGDPHADRTMVLYGDSHIGFWTRPIDRLAREHGWRVLLMLKTGCPPFDVPMYRPNPPARYTSCDRWRPWTMEKLREIKPDRIVVSGFTMQRIYDTDTDGRLKGDFGKAGRQVVVDGMARTLDELAGLTDDLWVIGDTNYLPRRAADCLADRHAGLATCVRERNPEVVARNSAWSRLVEARGGHFIDPGRWLCADDTCPLVVGNVIVYTDQHHLTRNYADQLTPLLGKALFGGS